MPAGDSLLAEAICNLRKGFARLWNELTAGDQVLLHDEATVLTRFPDDDEKETCGASPRER
jgi:hypothetical protein